LVIRYRGYGPGRPAKVQEEDVVALIQIQQRSDQALRWWRQVPVARPVQFARNDLADSRITPKSASQPVGDSSDALVGEQTRWSFARPEIEFGGGSAQQIQKMGIGLESEDLERQYGQSGAVSGAGLERPIGVHPGLPGQRKRSVRQRGLLE